MKRIYIIALLIVFLLSGVPAYASDEAQQVGEAVNYYFQDQTLTAFIRASDEDFLQGTKAAFQDSEEIVDSWSVPKTVSDTDTAIGYLFVIDVSGSMPRYRDRIRNVVQGILNNETQPYRVTVAAMGDRFRVLEEDITTTDRVLETLAEISYTDQVSKICDGLLDAIEYQKTKPPVDGELQSIVLMTDGDSILEGTGREPEAIARIADTTRSIVEDAAEYTVHTVGFSRWDPVTYNAVSVSAGLDRIAGDTDSALSCGAEIARFTDSLYRVRIPYARNDYSSRFDGKLVFISSATEFSQSVALNKIRNFDAKDPEVIPHFDDSGMLIGEERVGPDSTEPWDGPDSAEPTQGPETGYTAAAPRSVGETSAAGDGEQVDTRDGPPRWLLIAIAPIVLAALLAAAVAVLAKRCRKEKRGDDRAPRRDRPSNYIIVVPEAVYGSIKWRSKELRLYDELLIGSSESCDILIEDGSVSPRNTRVFLEDGVVYIEDLNGSPTTYLGGMKIFSKNRLRSGDEIMIGNTAFKLRF